MPDTLNTQVGSYSDRGPVREENEDALGQPADVAADLLARRGQLYVVADGMGGHAAGQVASQMAVRSVLNAYYGGEEAAPPAALQAAIGSANQTVHAAAADPALAGMGTTMVAAVVQGAMLYVANVGDSRAYLVRGRRVRQLTFDHSWVAEQLRAGTLTPAQARNHPYVHMIMRSLGTRPAVEVDLFQEHLQPGDVVVLCSDGVWEALPNGQLAQIALSGTAQQAAEALVAQAYRQGAQDNCSAIVLRIAGHRPTGWHRVGVIAVLCLLIAVGGLALNYYLQPGPETEKAPIVRDTGIESPPAAWYYYFSGRVERVQETGDEVMLEISNSTRRWWLICSEVSLHRLGPNGPRRGDLVFALALLKGGASADLGALDAEAVEIHRYELWRDFVPPGRRWVWYDAAHREGQGNTLSFYGTKELSLAEVGTFYVTNGHLDRTSGQLYVWNNEAQQYVKETPQS
jgi:serine/threonine protein phosphatase PrpC